MSYKNFAGLKKELSVIVLCYNRQEVASRFLCNLRKHLKVDNSEIIVSCNGGEQDWAINLYKDKVFDKLILSQENEGCGFGTMRLFNYVASKYSLYIQCDHDISRDFTNEEWRKMKLVMEENPQIGCIDFAGNGTFSERGFLISTDFYNENPSQEGGGPGPFEHVGKWTEETTREWIRENKKVVATWPFHMFHNHGKFSERETPCGGKFRIRCDTQETWVIDKPKERYVYPDFTDEEWNLVLSGDWIGGTIPENQKKNSFNCFGA